MVRFTLFCRSKGKDMKMEFPKDDAIRELDGVITDYYGNGFILRNGYSKLASGLTVGECISEGDRVEVIPDPETYFAMEPMRRP